MNETIRERPRKGHGGRKPVLPPVGGLDDPDCFIHHMQRYLLSLVVRGQSQHTAISSKAALTRFIRWCEKRSLFRPSQIDRPLVELFQQSLFFHRKRNGEPLSARSMQFLLIPLRQWFSWMVKQGHLPFSPASELELPRVPRRLPKAILSAQEAETVLAVPDVHTAVGLRDRAILETLYSTGIRRTELTRLTIQDIDRNRGTLMVREGKGKKDRMIPIGERALAWIAAYRDRARPELLRDKLDDGALFLNSLGNPIRPFHLTMLTKRYITRAAIGKEGACHLFRHTCATVLLEGGMDTRYIQAILGHASLESTQIYTRVSIQKLKALHTAVHPGKLPTAGTY
ncbi:MAG: site-specific tyrosine recombinase XerC [Geothrix sp.]|uniref:site-specific tyrosine recombinase XerC n=1 Tax=Geothrix sp. TaxID=1962974 RepID=UPI003BAEE0EA